MSNSRITVDYYAGEDWKLWNNIKTDHHMNERHTLYYRPTLTATPEKVRIFKTYKAALVAGMRECGHGKFWVDSEHRKDGSTRWTEFAPPQPSLDELATQDA